MARTRPPSSPLPLALAVRRHGDELAVAGELDLATAPRLDRVLRWLERQRRTLRLDLRDVSFVDCAGWSPIVAAVQRQRLSGRPELQVVDTSRQVRRFLNLWERCSATD